MLTKRLRIFSEHHTSRFLLCLYRQGPPTCP
jgi:hypothetical protein